MCQPLKHKMYMKLGVVLGCLSHQPHTHLHPASCPQGKLEKEQRDALIARGQQLKEELAAMEEKLGEVRAAWGML